LTFNRSDPKNPHRLSVEEAEFDRMGSRIVERLREQLGADVEIIDGR